MTGFFLVYQWCTIILCDLCCHFEHEVYSVDSLVPTDLVSFSHVVYMCYFYLFMFFFFKYMRKSAYIEYVYVISYSMIKAWLWKQFWCTFTWKHTALVTFFLCSVNVCSVQNRISACDAAPVKCVDKYAEFSFCTVHEWPSSAGSHGFVNEMKMAFWVDAAALFSGEGERQDLAEPTLIPRPHKGSSPDSF